MSGHVNRRAIEHLNDLPTYAPPGHSGTTNRRLVEGDFCGSFELVHGSVAPGGRAERHSHADEHQVMFVLAGEARVVLGDDEPVRCGPGTVVRIAPGLPHAVDSVGDVTLQVLIVYSPPLPPRGE